MSVQVQDHASNKVVVTGNSGVGKTTLWHKLVERARAKHKLFFDIKSGDLARRFAVRSCFDEEDMFDALEAGRPAIFNPSRHFAGKPEEAFKFFCRTSWELCKLFKGVKSFGTDELDQLVDNRCEPEDLCVILDQGRTYQVDCYFIAQAMNGIHNQVRKQITEIFVMKQGDRNGVEWLVEKGFDAREISGLKNGQWLYQNTNTGATARGGKAFTPKNAERNLKGL